MTGFVIKLKSHRTYSERRNLWRGMCLGPFYFRTNTVRAGV